MTDSDGSRSGAMTLGRSFLLWLLGVLVVTLVLVSALVLWHEQSILEDELQARAELLAYILGLAAADGGSPEYSGIISMADVRAGEVRDGAGHVVWRYGPALAEVEALDSSLLRIERQSAGWGIVRTARAPRWTWYCWYLRHGSGPIWRHRPYGCWPASVWR